jgi:hypothetical protein
MGIPFWKIGSLFLYPHLEMFLYHTFYSKYEIKKKYIYVFNIKILYLKYYKSLQYNLI